MQRLTRPELDKLLIALRDGGTRRRRARPAAVGTRSLNAAIDAWRRALAYGGDRKELSHNVAASMKKVPQARREMATYAPDEIRRVLRAADEDRNGHLWYLALSGLRRGEIAGLKWTDIDFPEAPSPSRATGSRPVRPTLSRTNRRRWRRVARCRSTRV